MTQIPCDYQIQLLDQSFQTYASYLKKNNNKNIQTSKINFFICLNDKNSNISSPKAYVFMKYFTFSMYRNFKISCIATSTNINSR